MGHPLTQMGVYLCQALKAFALYGVIFDLLYGGLDLALVGGRIRSRGHN